MQTPRTLALSIATTLLLGSGFAWSAPATAESTAAEARSSEPARNMDLRSLETRLRETRAIDPIAKLKLKGQIDELLGRIREVHETGASENVGALRQPYERVIGSIQAKLDRDPALASDIVSSREAIWAVLSDPQKFRVQTAKGAKTEPKATFVSTTAGQ